VAKIVRDRISVARYSATAQAIDKYDVKLSIAATDENPLAQSVDLSSVR
jgi:hypothetical protein